jgi:phosphodiester glycosidase
MAGSRHRCPAHDSMQDFAAFPITLSKHRHAKLALALALALLVGADSIYSARCLPQPTAIFSGITYGCALLERTEEGNGILHWVRVELEAPGIELYVTPLEPSAVERGFQYRLRWIDDVVRNERLAVAVNGALFTSTPGWRPRWPGDLAKGVETVVSDHVTSHFWEHTYLLWFDDNLDPHLRPSKPPEPEELRKAKWGIGGQGVGLRGGEVWSGSSRKPDSRTGIGIDAERKLLFLAVAERASPRLMLERLAKLGARDAMLLDGGSSSAMAIGEGGRLPSGTLLGGWRPVATFFGVRARPPGPPQGD